MSAAGATPLRLTGRPVIWDAEEDLTAAPPSARIRERAERLGRGLRSVGVQAGQRVVVLCCAEHLEDRATALAALEAVGAVAEVPVDWSDPALAELLARRGSPGVHLACEEGVAAWRGAKGTGVMIGEGEGVLWWKALECRHAAEAPVVTDP